jgi:hypothetical protein
MELPLDIERQMDALAEKHLYSRNIYGHVMDGFWAATNTSEQKTIGEQQKAVREVLEYISEWDDTDPIKRFGNDLKKLFEIEDAPKPEPPKPEPPKPVEMTGPTLKVARPRERPPGKLSMFRRGY